MTKLLWLLVKWRKGSRGILLLLLLTYSHTKYFILDAFSLHNHIMEITGSKVKNAQKILDSIVNRIDGVDAATTKANVSLKTTNR